MPFTALFPERFPALTQARPWAGCCRDIGYHGKQCLLGQPEKSPQGDIWPNLGNIREGFLEVAWLGLHFEA